MPSFATNAIFVLIFFALGLSVMYQGFFGLREIGLGGERTASGLLHLLSIPFVCSLTHLVLRRWFRPWIASVSGGSLWTLVSLTFGLYAFASLFNAFNGISQVSSVTREPVIIFLAQVLLNFVLSLIFGFSLLLLSTRMLRKPELDTRNLRLATISLGSYGVGGLLSGFVVAWGRLTGIISYPFADSALNATLWMGSIGGLIVYTVFLFLAIDVIWRGSLRGKSVYLAFLLVGVAYLISNASTLLRNGICFAVYGRLYDDVLIVFPIAEIFVYLLVIAASASLVRGGSWEGRTLNLSKAAIFLYAGTNILLVIIGISLMLQVVMGPLAYLSQWRQGLNLAGGLASMPYWISLLSIGFLLDREQKQKAKEQPTGESPAEIGSSIRS